MCASPRIGKYSIRVHPSFALGLEILTSAGQLIDWKATIHFDTTPWEAVNLRATRASVNRVDASVSLLNKKQRDIFTEPEPCSPWRKLKRRREGRVGNML